MMTLHLLNFYHSMLSAILAKYSEINFESGSHKLLFVSEMYFKLKNKTVTILIIEADIKMAFQVSISRGIMKS